MTKVLVVDDSALMRRLLGELLGGAGFEVQHARNGAEGVERLVAWQPDVVTLDVNMPEMDGLTALSLMMQARPTPVVMVSSLTERGALATLEALALGAVDFIAKPGGTISLSVETIARQLVDKVRGAARARLRPATAQTTAGRPAEAARAGQATKTAPAPPAAASRSVPGLVVIGVSTGGPRTLEEILPLLPAGFPWPVVVAQHMPPNFTDAFARRMDQLCALQVREVQGVCELAPGQVWIGRGGTDVVVSERAGRSVVMARPEAPHLQWHPSVQALVESAGRHFAPQQLLAVQLTGMGNDGAEAMAALHRRGVRTIAEAESTAIVWGMPQELVRLGGATRVLPCHAIADQLIEWAQAR